MYIYIYIYIRIEREREREMYIIVHYNISVHYCIAQAHERRAGGPGARPG